MISDDINDSEYCFDDCTIESLPDEILENILSYVAPYDDLQCCAAVSKRFHGIVKSKFSLVGIALDDNVGQQVFLLPSPPSFRRCSIFTSVTLIGSRDLAVKSLPNRFALQGKYYRETFFLLPTGVIRHTKRKFQKSISEFNVEWDLVTTPLMTIARRYSHSACLNENCMYVFGGCTPTGSTFNDLWCLNLNTRQWERPLTVGSYPSPKAYTTLVSHDHQLILFGGWTHPSPFPLHQPEPIHRSVHCSLQRLMKGATGTTLVCVWLRSLALHSRESRRQLHFCESSHCCPFESPYPSVLPKPLFPPLLKTAGSPHCLVEAIRSGEEPPLGIANPWFGGQPITNHQSIPDTSTISSTSCPDEDSRNQPSSLQLEQQPHRIFMIPGKPVVKGQPDRRAMTWDLSSIPAELPRSTKCLLKMVNWCTVPVLSHVASWCCVQPWKLFNELHVYDIPSSRWINVATVPSPPALAGHSATMQGRLMVVFGGVLQSKHGGHERVR
ncbi:hypothetical protein PR048_022917 [Dryococelus australis]|uniref:F-box domain-containing protein n=1 Tax=Dryococelus australis TaxID=614101 RepID=A0ABQ9GSK3_9NEOP|nr:hypothetical protein PR048_022917 [Dryococelus australis]